MVDGSIAVIRVCFLGAYDPDYPRVRVFREGLATAGIEVIEARVPERRAFRRFPALISAFDARARSADAILVPAFRHKDVPMARLLRGRRPLLFDPLVSRHDTLVNDWALHPPGSAQARWNRWIDRASLGLADRVLCDTWEHGHLYRSLGVAEHRLVRVLVGAERAFFDVPDAVRDGPVRVLYVGGFLPLHGVPVMIEAAARLERSGVPLPDWTLDLVGQGIEYGTARAVAERHRLTRVRFLGRRPYAQAPALFAESSIVLGAFGGSDKAGRVIPHKVFQGLAAGRAVITGDGPGIREVLDPGTHLLAVPRGDAAALADALRIVIGSADRRAALASAGRARAQEVGTPEQIGVALRHAIESALAERA
jgi:glycosyltransferase involved in cell wall biosynthesis